METSYYFYLLGECANESVGMKCGEIIVEEFTPKGEIPSDQESSKDVFYTAENTDVGVRINTPQTRSEAFRGKKAKI